MSWARLYGGAGIIVGANDGRAPWLPLREESVSSVDYLTPVDCRRLIPLQFQTDLFAPGYGLPTHYEVINTFSMSTGPVVVHASRVIRFEGTPRTSRPNASAGGGPYPCCSAATCRSATSASPTRSLSSCSGTTRKACSG